MTDTEAAKPKKQVTPEQQAARKATRSVARALARTESKAGETEFKATWDEKKSHYTGEARKLVRALAREGLTITAAEGGKLKGKGKGGKKARGGDAADAGQSSDA